MIDLNLDKDEVIYFEEFINLLYEARLLNPDFQEIIRNSLKTTETILLS